MSRGLTDATAWLEDRGVVIEKALTMPHGGTGRRSWPAQLIQALVAHLTSLGVTPELETGLAALERAKRGTLTVSGSR